MSWMTISQESGQALADSFAADRPSVGRLVTITGGRKHKGKTGKVFWHGKDGYNPMRYGGSFTRSLNDISGRYGYRVGVETESGERFFVPGEYTRVAAATGSAA